jgi:hypothetical protein
MARARCCGNSTTFCKLKGCTDLEPLLIIRGRSLLMYYGCHNILHDDTQHNVTPNRVTMLCQFFIALFSFVKQSFMAPFYAMG